MSQLSWVALILPPAATLLFLLLRAIRLRTALKSVPMRIHVGGTRGKSSVCRLVAAALRASGIRTVAKTTGTAPILILPDGAERPWRRFGPASIGEQRRFALLASRLEARASVLECMAIRPELIAASERDLVRATIAVITNIRADHLEDTPSSAAVAEGFLGLVPRNGVVVVGEDALLPALRDRAGERGTKVVAVRISGLSADAANRAIASAVCEAAGTFWLRRAARRRGLDCRTLPAMPWLGGRTLLERIAERVPEGALVWGVGNYHGRGAAISSALEQR
jgi:gamma-polyglutamate synthase